MEASDIAETMMRADAFSQWLGIECLEVGPGISVLRMTIRKEMLNGFGVAHGGITFSFADSAFAFISNGRGRHAVSIETSISHTRPLKEGDVIIATAEEDFLGSKTGVYRVKVTKENGETVALFKGTVFRKDQSW